MKYKAGGYYEGELSHGVREGVRTTQGVAGRYVGSPGRPHPSLRSDSGPGWAQEPVLAQGAFAPRSVWGPWPWDPACRRISINHHCGSNPVAQNNCDIIVCPQPQGSAAWPSSAGKVSGLVWGLPSSCGHSSSSSAGGSGALLAYSLRPSEVMLLTEQVRRPHLGGERTLPWRAGAGQVGVPWRPKDQSAHCSGRATSRTEPRGHNVRRCLYSVCSHY